jgi:hypothetical protein
MTILRYNKCEHKLKLTSGKIIELYVVTDYDFGSNYSIVKIESATGDGGVTYNNGRMVENIPISGVLLGKSLNDINNKALDLRKVADRKEVVEFIYPYKSDIRTNLFYIEDIRLTPIAGKNTELNFTLTLTEKRNANVKTTAVNLVSFAPSELFKQIYKERSIGT